MRGWKRLIYYILINIVVSAATTLVVLNIWERTHPPLTEMVTPTALAAASPSAAAPATSAPVADVTTEAITPTEALPPTETPRPSPTLELIEYQVKSGDTLGSIAMEFDISIADILAVNSLDNPDNLSIGQMIYIPTGPVPVAIPPTATETAESTPTPRPPTATPTYGPSPTPSATLTGREPGVTISNVIGAGDLANERVVLTRTGDGELDMAGWRLEDSDGHVYSFPQLTLYKDGAVNIYTQAGQNTVVDLYWGLETAVWQAGETVTLYDAQGNPRATYQVP